MRKKLLLFLTLAVLGWGSVCAQTQKYSGHAPSDVIGGSTDNDKILYLYNVGTEKFLDKGGIWGTQTALSSVAGFPLALETKNNYSGYFLKTTIKTSSNADGHIEVQRSGTAGETEDWGEAFVDQGTLQANFVFTAATLEGYSNVYTLSTTYSYTSYGQTYSTTYYLVADAENNKVVTSTTAPTDANGMWILVTKADLLAKFQTADASNASPAEATFVMKDYDFMRNNSEVSSWKQSNGTAMTNANTTTTPTAVASASTVYYIGNGYSDSQTFTEDEDGNTYTKDYKAQKLYGGDWTGNVHGASGKLYQQVTVTLRAGWYKIGCEGFSTDGSGKLFAQVGSETTIGDTYKTVAFKTLATSDVPTTYVKAARLINGGGYEQSVEVYVEKDQTITFGVLVEGGSSSSWTCVDNFSIKYCGGEKQQTVAQLILSEDETSVDYINKQVNPEKSFTLRLHRSLSANMWNSLVLPVSLTGAQVQSAFGGNTKLSKLAKTANNGKQIIFEPVTVSNDDNEAITAGELYIIKPQNSETSFAEAQTRSDIEDFNVSINSGYTITQVTLPAEVKASVSGPIVDGGDEDGNLQHVGTYVKVAENAIPKDTYILSKGKWYYNTVAVTSVKGFRGWIATNVEKATESKMTFVIDGVEEEVGGATTAIDAIGADQSANSRSAKGIYSLSGQKISDGVATDGLGKGVYIVGGKKVVIK